VSRAAHSSVGLQHHRFCGVVVFKVTQSILSIIGRALGAVPRSFSFALRSRCSPALEEVGSRSFAMMQEPTRSLALLVWLAMAADCPRLAASCSRCLLSRWPHCWDWRYRGTEEPAMGCKDALVCHMGGACCGGCWRLGCAWCVAVHGGT